jgi:hypothetical protein
MFKEELQDEAARLHMKRSIWMALFSRQNELKIIHMKWHTLLCIMRNKISQRNKN